MSHAYPGDRPDVTQFTAVLDELIARYRLLVDSVQSLTVVYDAGQNSCDNHEAVEATAIGRRLAAALGPPRPAGHRRTRYRVVDRDRYDDLTASTPRSPRWGRPAAR